MSFLFIKHYNIINKRDITYLNNTNMIYINKS